MKSTRKRLVLFLLSLAMVMGFFGANASAPVYAENIATSAQMEVIRKIIYAVETGGQVYGNVRYDDFTPAYANSSIEHAITIGGGQWYATEAKRLLNLIRSTDRATFSRLDTAGIGTDLDTKDWSTYQVARGSAKAVCIQKIISSDVGIRCQDQLIDDQMRTYMAEARNLGVTDIDAQMMCANFRHQGGLGAVKRIIAKTTKPYTLDNLYAACKTDTGNQVGAYKNRQIMVYNSLKKYLPLATNSIEDEVKKFVFNASYYASRYEDLQKAFGNDESKLYNHFINNGISEGRCASPYFDVSWYMNNNDQQLRDHCGGDRKKAYQHFLNYVKNEGELANHAKKLSPIFDTGYYYNKYKDLRDAGLNTEFKLLQHFYNNGTKEWRTGSAEFDPVCYALNNQDVYNEYIVKQNKNVPGIYYHYMRHGQFETGEKPNRTKTAEIANLGTDFYASITDKHSGKNLELVYNVTSSEYSDKNSVQINTAGDTEAQIWHFERQQDGTYKITNKKYGKVMDVYNNLRTKANIGAWSDNGSGAQRWTLYRKDGYVVMKGGCTGFVADVGGKNTADYSEVVCDAFNGGDNQLFAINIMGEDFGESFSASINTVCDETKALSLNENESVVVKTDTGAADQIWKFEQQSDGSYKIINTANGKCLDVSGGNTANKTDILTYEDNGSTAQRWYIIRDTDGSCVIRPVCGMAANVTMNLYGISKGDQIPEGQNISIYGFNGSDAQQFIIRFKSEDLGTDFDASILTICDENKALTNSNGNLVIKTNAETDDQLWHFERQSDGTYTLANKVDNKCIDLENWKTANMSNIALHTAHGGTNQRWAFVKNANGSYTIRPVCGFGANAVMDLYGANTADGSNISIYRYNGTDAQQYQVVKIPAPPVIRDVQVSQVTTKGYRVTCTVDAEAEIKKVKFSTWSDSNGQDDIIWHVGTVKGNKASFYVSAKDHKNEAGTYTTHIYAYDNKGRYVVKEVKTDVPAPKNTISEVKVSDVTEEGYRVTCTVNAEAGIKKVKFPTWSKNQGRDDLIWHTGTVSGNTATFYVNVKDHKNDAGKYVTRIYVYDKQGNFVTASARADVPEKSSADASPSK